MPPKPLAFPQRLSFPKAAWSRQQRCERLMDTNEIVIKKMQRYCAAMVSIFSENAFVSRASRRECIRIFKLFRSVKDVLTTWDRDCFRSDVLLRRRILPALLAIATSAIETSMA
jgi:hypothetical protein